MTVNVYTTADGGKCLFTFFGWGENIMVEGLLIGGHVASVTYDSVGYFGQDAAKMWDLVRPCSLGSCQLKNGMLSTGLNTPVRLNG